MNLVDKSLYTDIGGWGSVSLEETAEWFQVLCAEGNGSVHRAATMLIARLNFLYQNSDFVGPIDEPVLVAGQLGLWNPELNKDIPNAFLSGQTDRPWHSSTPVPPH
ncbi:hypothetical protein OIU34_20385 [Pararhizobium sp. BT-229]|uniref:hypothetical protein n=1 Tax=Pararhizobium sp. BT-229 TaxID=2986923 RepID=UPI0021F7ADD2|nr:hypothetical protein [Pararhizobium sp. BT-229]MCV9964247.1 hypothetical protein [Pararhizobium sp. BT-229]